MTLDDLAHGRCEPRKGQSALPAATVRDLLAVLPGWEVASDGKSIAKAFKFANFHATLGFINAVGWMANRQDHHPDLEAGYGRCVLHWSTHDVSGLSLNDFICAAKVEQIASA